MSCASVGRWCLKVGAKRRLAVDFARMEELASESLTGTPTVELLDSGSGLVLTDLAIDGTRVAFWADAAAGAVAAGKEHSDYRVRVTVGTTGGAVLPAEGSIRVRP